MTAVDYARAHAARVGFSQELSRVFVNADLIICPAMSGVALPIHNPQFPGDFTSGNMLTFTAPFDLSGSPTLTQRAGFAESGLPLAQSSLLDAR